MSSQAGNHTHPQGPMDTADGHPLLFRGERVLFQTGVLLLETLQTHLGEQQTDYSFNGLRSSSHQDIEGSASASTTAVPVENVHIGPSHLAGPFLTVFSLLSFSIFFSSL